MTSSPPWFLRRGYGVSERGLDPDIDKRIVIENGANVTVSDA